MWFVLVSLMGNFYGFKYIVRRAYWFYRQLNAYLSKYSFNLNIALNIQAAVHAHITVNN